MSKFSGAQELSKDLEAAAHTIGTKRPVREQTGREERKSNNGDDTPELFLRPIVTQLPSEFGS